MPAPHRTATPRTHSPLRSYVLGDEHVEALLNDTRNSDDPEVVAARTTLRKQLDTYRRRARH